MRIAMLVCKGPRRACVGAVLLASWLAAVSPAAAAVGWEDASLDEVVRRAKDSNRWVLVDVYASWCGPCHQMDAQVYARQDVGRALASGFLALRRDGEQGEGQAIASRYHVVGFPTLLVLDDEGKEVDRLMGFVTPGELIATLQRFREGKGTLAELQARLARTPADEGLRLEVGTRHAWRGEARAIEELEAVVQHDPENRSKRAAAALRTLGKYYYLRGARDHARAEATLSALVQRFPSSEEARDAPYDLGLAYHGLGQDDRAREVLDRWLADAPTDGSRYNAYAWLCFKHGFDRARGVEVAKQGLAADPRDHALWDTLGELYAALGRRAEARTAARRALKLRPKDPYYRAQARRYAGRR